MFEPIQTDLTVSAYEDWKFDYSIVDEDGAVKPLTGASAIWVLMGEPDGPELLRKTTGAGIAVTDAEHGTLAVTVAKADNQSLLPRVYYHELQITLAGVSKKVSVGALTVRPTGIRA